MSNIDSIKVKISTYWNTPITTEKEARGYFRLLWKEFGLIFHPDDPFELYLDYNTGEHIFDEEAANILNARMDECFELLNDDIYAIAMDEGRYLGIYK